MFDWKKIAVDAENVALALVRRWWRPVICLGLGWSLLVNGVVIPLWTKHPADLAGLAAMVASLAPFAWLRTQEKVQGVSSKN